MNKINLRGIRNNYNPGDELVVNLPHDEHRDVIFSPAKGDFDGENVTLSVSAAQRVKRYQAKGFKMAAEVNGQYYPIKSNKGV